MKKARTLTEVVRAFTKWYGVEFVCENIYNKTRKHELLFEVPNNLGVNLSYFLGNNFKVETTYGQVKNLMRVSLR